jgi:mannitol-1-phosphate 5-dehydrogenase
MKDHVFVGFGFGPIQSGLFAAEAFNSGNFRRIVIAEIDQSLVDAVGINNGTYYVNVATNDGIVAEQIEGIEIFNPMIEDDKKELIKALREATEIATSLPSVDFYDTGDSSVAKLIAFGLSDSTAPATIIYAAENNNRAAEILEQEVSKYLDIKTKKVQFLNTVIGKMSQITIDEAMINNKSLKTIAPGSMKAFLVEAFNCILVTKAEIEGFTPGIEVFVEKFDLLPFEEAKLFGHNAIHALLAYMGLEKGYETMDQIAGDTELMQIASDAFIKESGGAMIGKYASLDDEMFTEAGYTAYAKDLLVRMTNHFLADSIARAGRDPRRKLSSRDRIFGTIKLALEYGVEPVNMARGAKAGLKYLLVNADANELPSALRFDADNLKGDQISKILKWLWNDDDAEMLAKISEMVAAS